MLIPNIGRVIVRRLTYTDQMLRGGIIIPGQLKAGENLYVGEVVHPGTNALGEKTRFNKGQIIYYSEYSAASLVDMSPVITGKKSLGDVGQNSLYVVAEDDIMAYEDDLSIKVPEKAKLAPAPINETKSPIFTK